MAFTIAEPNVVPQAIAETSTTAQNTLGKIVRAKDSTLGMGEFIYLLGATNTVVGSAVIWNATTFQTVLATNTGEQGAPVAWAMSANVASQYGWYQMEGLVTAKKTNVVIAPQVPVYLSGTAGRVKAIASEGKGIEGARSANLVSVTTTTSTVILLVNRPHLQGFRSA